MKKKDELRERLRSALKEGPPRNWDEFYERFRSELEKIEEYEERIKDLEAELERRDVYGFDDEIRSAIDEKFAEWEDFYQKYRVELDKIPEYERRIEELESRIERAKKGFRARYESEKPQILALTALFFIAALIFMRMISKSDNVWLFFFGGALVGLGSAGVLKMLTM
ncbi:MAG: hypothetical protein ACE5PM_03155 [Candidatus Hydrothermarchaeales archaeon]